MAGANDRIKRIFFANSNTMQTRTFEFNFTLKIASAYPHSDYFFRREHENDDWRVQSIRRNLRH